MAHPAMIVGAFVKRAQRSRGADGSHEWVEAAEPIQLGVRDQVTVNLSLWFEGNNHPALADAPAGNHREYAGVRPDINEGHSRLERIHDGKHFVVVASDDRKQI